MPHLHSIPIFIPFSSVYSLSHLSRVSIVTVKHSDMSNFSSYLWQTIFQVCSFVLSNRQQNHFKVIKLFHLHSAVKSPSISLTPHCSLHLTQKSLEGSEGVALSTATLSFIHSFCAASCGVLAPVAGFQATCHFFFSVINVI